ncbi:hypothetical protein MMC30_000748 [Trapelia coarctata]|nr:hypothetical protein [Trapelia coarctata]
MEASRILQLSNAIAKSTATIHENLTAKGLPFPTFDIDGPESLPEELSTAQDALLDATSELHDLLLGPFNALENYGSHNNLVSLHAIIHFNLASKFAPGKEISFAQLAELSGLSEPLIRRLLRHAMMMRVFSEPRKGIVAHTAASKLLTRPNMHSWLGTGCEEMWPAALRVGSPRPNPERLQLTCFKTVDAISKWPDSQEPNQTGFALANNTEDSMYQVIGSDPSRAKRFADTMEAFTSGKGFEASHIIDNYNWHEMVDGLVVDIGGAGGHFATSLAQHFESLHVTVQDLEGSMAGAVVPKQLASRVRFMVHDFFTPQPVVADVYYFRWIFHNWPDKYCVQILRCLIPALKPGARVLIHDICMPEPGKIAHWREKQLRRMDLNMLGILNARERDADEWGLLFHEADSRFEYLGVNQPEGSSLAIMEARWKS